MPGPRRRVAPAPRAQSNPISDALNAVGRFARDTTRAREQFKPPSVGNWGVKKYGPQAPGIHIGPRTRRP